MTSPRVIAVLEAGGRADQDLLYVEISRASEGFELVVDDREQLAERLAERPGIDEGALEAIGADLAAPVVDPDLFAGLQADWRSLRRSADKEGRVLYLADGYGEVVAQIVALGVIEDLPADMRRFVDTVLGEHTAHQQRRQQNPRPGRKSGQPLATMAGTLLEGVVARRGAGDAR